MAQPAVAQHPKVLELRKLPIEAKRALSLWRDKKNSVFFNPRFSAVKHSIVAGKNGKPKALIAKYLHKSPFGNDVLWFYYPRAKDIPEFARATNYVKPHGPATISPGAVGSINVIGHPNYWTIGWVQAHFHTKKEGGIKRALATEYGGWRVRLFTEILSEAKKVNAKVSFNPENSGFKVIEDFKKAAAGVGLSVTSPEFIRGKPVFVAE